MRPSSAPPLRRTRTKDLEDKVRSRLELQSLSLEQCEPSIPPWERNLEPPPVQGVMSTTNSTSIDMFSPCFRKSSSKSRIKKDMSMYVGSPIASVPKRSPARRRLQSETRASSRPRYRSFSASQEQASPSSDLRSKASPHKKGGSLRASELFRTQKSAAAMPQAQMQMKDVEVQTDVTGSFMSVYGSSALAGLSSDEIELAVKLLKDTRTPSASSTMRQREQPQPVNPSHPLSECAKEDHMKLFFCLGCDTGWVCYPRSSWLPSSLSVDDSSERKSSDDVHWQKVSGRVHDEAKRCRLGWSLVAWGVPIFDIIPDGKNKA